MALLNNGNEEIVGTSERHKCKMTFSLLKASELKMKEEKLTYRRKEGKSEMNIG